MFYTEIGLTQYEMHDPVSFLDRYNTDMRIITTTATVAAGKVELVEQESKDRDEALQDGIDTNHNDIVNNANDISELKAKDEELEGRIDLNAQDIAALQVTTTSISAQLLNHIETSTSFAAGVMQKVEDNYTELKTDIMADRERISVAEVAISNIQQGDTEIAQKVATLEADNTQNKNAIADLEQVDQNQGESIQDLHGRMTTAESDISELKAKSLGADNRLATAEQNIEDLQARPNIFVDGYNNSYMLDCTVNAGDLDTDITFTCAEILKKESNSGNTTILYIGTAKIDFGYDDINQINITLKQQLADENRFYFIGASAFGNNLGVDNISYNLIRISKLVKNTTSPIKNVIITALVKREI